MFRGIVSILVGAVSVFSQAVNYTYDSGGRLAKADYGGGVVIVYTYDAAGHLVSRQSAVQSHCDLNGDGQVNVADVQDIINMALGITASTPAADLNGDGVVNVVDVQIMINVALGAAT